MSETCNFIIFKHNTEHPHYDLRLHIGREQKSWIVPHGIPENTKEKRVAVESESSLNSTSNLKAKEIYEDSYGNAEAELFDKGLFELETNRNIKIILKADGRKFKGKYILHVPNWGRWTKRRLWTIEKIS